MTLFKVLAFSLVILLSYTLFANILPQVQSDPPPEEEPIAPEGMDVAGLVAWGETLFSGKGTCTLCHNDLGRAPDILALDLGTVFGERLADPRYTGKAKGLEGAEAVRAYVEESMVEPSAYVVAGFGKKGTGDKVSPMPAVNAAPILLSDTEMDALTAFLQSRAGVDVTVPLPVAAEEAIAEAEEEEEGPAETAQAALEKFACSACHDLEGSEAEVGPKLGGLGARIGRDGVREAILDPNATVAEGFEPDMMPGDLGAQMRVSELELIVDYLMALPASGAQE